MTYGPRHPDDRLTVGEIRDVVCELEGVAFRQIINGSRHLEVIHARQTLAAALHHILGLSQPEIARTLSGRYHSSAASQLQAFGRRDLLEQADTLYEVAQMVRVERRRGLYARRRHEQFMAELEKCPPCP